MFKPCQNRPNERVESLIAIFVDFFRIVFSNYSLTFLQHKSIFRNINHVLKKH